MFETARTEAAADGLRFVTADPEIGAMRRGIFECVLAEGDHDRICGQMVTAGDMIHSVRVIPLAPASCVSGSSITGRPPVIGARTETAVIDGLTKPDAADLRRFGLAGNADFLPVLADASEHDPE